MRRASSKGFLLTVEAFLSLLVALLFISMLQLTCDAQAFSRSSLLAYQHVNDIAEVLWAAGDYPRIGQWAEGDEVAGEKVEKRLEGIASEMSWCIRLDFGEEGKGMDAGCSGSERETSITTRTIITGSGIHEMRISVSRR